jgi:outer membrane protein OmpA-like peptidoglycan-associated protein
MLKVPETAFSQQTKPVGATCVAWLISIFLAASVTGCGTTQPTVESPIAPSPAAEAASAASAATSKPTLLSEERRLSDLFHGTPVVFTMQPDGAMRVEIPLTFCFDEGKAKVKPPLAAVLDRMAASQAAEATHIAIAAPIDPGAKNQALGVERAISIRKFMVQKGISEVRFLAISVSTTGNLKLVVANSRPP